MDKLELPKKRKIVADASPIKRILAFIIDLFIIEFVIGSPFSGAISGIMPNSTNLSEYRSMAANPSLSDRFYWLFLAMFFLIFLYFVVFEAKLHQTPGKMIMKLYVRGIQKKNTLSIWQICLRNLIFLPIFPFILLWVVDPIFLLVKKQRFSDILAKTKVIEVYSV
ncbi:RDD family protein [Candidatus Woesearchaeota archaeon]|nr:RDD family protein [Candidatus Woesearchaeota archaeon]